MRLGREAIHSLFARTVFSCASTLTAAFSRHMSIIKFEGAVVRHTRQPKPTTSSRGQRAKNTWTTATAFHLAGDAVAVVLCGEDIDRTEAKWCFRRPQRYETGDNSSLIFVQTVGCTPDEAWKLDNGVFVCGAGPAAEAKATKKPFEEVLNSWRSASDWEHAEWLLETWLPDDFDPSAAIIPIWDEARELITSGPIWPAVCAVAHEFRSGGSRDLNQLIRAIIPDSAFHPLRRGPHADPESNVIWLSDRR
jgi:hypothetical protein